MSRKEAYETALNYFRDVSARHRVSAAQYRGRLIGDAEYLIVRREYDAAQAAVDAAEAALFPDDGDCNAGVVAIDPI